NITMQPAGSLGDAQLLDCVILLSRTKKMGASLELEGTNSEGDLGFGVGLTFQHRNLWKGSETLTTKFRTSYESLSGNLDGLINDRYTEFAGEVGITFPKFKAPFIPRHYKQRIIASSEVALSFNYQERPEYTRIISGAAWKYKWTNRSNTMRRTLDLLDVNFVYLPHSTLNFIDEIAPSNPLLRYSYEDHLIMRLGYTYYLTNRKMTTADISSNRRQQNFYTLRYSIETAGNTLYAISNLIGQKKSDGAYKVFGTQYSQYVKSEIEYTRTHYIDRRNSFAYRAGFGIGYPYGNSRMIPFEKRFYAGGANGVRGWGVRTLGPGSYDSKNSVTDFINQCGDISLDLSVEYRAKLFWVFEGALFIDAGNIWTIHNYENQPGGMFKFNSFYKEIAASYGAGLRMDFTYFVLRLDLGIKAHNPAMNQEAWPLIHPRWHRDATLHFAVGYPF
ncbi:MAG: outer membrane protein assembly factor, partial [Muribaculaceae bacterium]|nr:outer membrane protein assembly factor [Muribaculaceae bacterium]